MHETVIVGKIIEKAKETGDVSSIHVEVGELCELTKEEVEETLKDMTSWDVEVSHRKGKVKCGCGYKGKARIVERGHGFCIFNCPKCGGKPKVLEGGEIKIVELG